ncbi:unnamed protein product [Moneuplotes crassus]|uniref:Uncharacterized protein n=1 Tax=Euplotes crassus TaxID=5936 RepID=A0AAD1X9C9_EUPCR|nr:unnamed protein product [Moneuplotes crassus]
MMFISCLSCYSDAYAQFDYLFLSEFSVFTKRERICFYKVFMPFINLKRRVCDAIV